MTQVSKQLSATPKQAACCPAPIDDLLDPEFFKGLSDPTRLTILGCLAKCGRPCSVTELAQCCAVDFSVVSRHLALLERAGIVEAAKDGRTVFYAVKYAQLSGKLRALAKALEGYRPGSGCAGGKRDCCAQP